jgi:hypothetical protein
MFGPEILTTRPLLQCLGQHGRQEPEKNRCCDHQSHAERIQIRPAGHDESCHGRRQSRHHPATSPERRITACKHNASADRSHEAQHETDLMQEPVPAHRWRPGRRTRREAGTGVGSENSRNDQSDTAESDEQRPPGIAATLS